MPYNVGDPGPAGGWIFATPTTPGNNTPYYFEAGPVDIAFGTMPSGGYGMNCAGLTTWMPLQQPNLTAPTIVPLDAEFGAMKYNVQTGANIGDGITNTQLLTQPGVTATSFNVAANMCDNYSTQGVNPINQQPMVYEDWFLPSAGEAKMMMQNVGASTAYNVDLKFLVNNQTINTVNYPNSSKYWTSSAQTSHPYHMKANIIDSVTGLTTLATRCHTFGVRPIRMFVEEELVEKEYRCRTANDPPSPLPCIGVPINTSPSNVGVWSTVADCNAAAAAGECTGISISCPEGQNCYNYRDGVGGVSFYHTPRKTPIYTPGLSGSGGQASTSSTDNKGHNYEILTEYDNGVTGVVTEPFTQREYLNKFFKHNNQSQLSIEDYWDSIIGLPWFNFNISQTDAMGNILDYQKFKISNMGYTIRIWDKKKRKLGAWKYDSCQICHPTVKYHMSHHPNSPLRSEIDSQCNNFPELCKSTKLRVLLVMEKGKFPQMIEPHHEHGFDYPVMQYGFQNRSLFLGSEPYPIYNNPSQLLNVSYSWKGIAYPGKPIQRRTVGQLNAATLNFPQESGTGGYGSGFYIPSFGHINEDHSMNITCNPNKKTASFAYLQIVCDETHQQVYSYANVDTGSNTDLHHMNMICDLTEGAWVGQNLYTVPNLPSLNAPLYGPNKCGEVTTLSSPFSANVSPSSLPYITPDRVVKVTENCRNEGLMGKGVNDFQPQTTVPCNDFATYPSGCIIGDPINPCLFSSKSASNMHAWMADFKPGDGSFGGGGNTWTNITWHNSLRDFIYDHQATPNLEPNFHCNHLIWTGSSVTGGSTESNGGKGRGENGEYIITEFNLDTSHIPAVGSRKSLSIVGDPDATFTLTAYTEDATILYYDWESNNWTTAFTRLVWQKLPSSGIFTRTINFPLETANTIYNIQLSAEPHFNTKLEIPGVLSTITHIKKIYQYIDKKITFTSSSDDHTGEYTLPTDVEISGSPSIVTIDDVETLSAGKGDITGSISWTYTLKNDRFIIAKQPNEHDFKSSTTQTLDGAVATDDGTSGLKLTLDDISGLIVGMEITAVSAGSLSGTPKITAIDSTETSSTYKQITIDIGQAISDGVTLTFTGTGSRAANSIYNAAFSLNNFKVVLNDVTTTTTSTVSDSTTIPVTSIKGIKPKSATKKLKNASSAVTTVNMMDDISDLGIGQVLVSVDNSDTITGTATITKINTGTKEITFNEPVTLSVNAGLTFASTFINSTNICSDSKPYVDSISGFNLTASSAVTLDDGETLTFTGSSNSATITSDVIVTSMGETDATVTLQLDNILKVS